MYTRREMLSRLGMGFGSLALYSLFDTDSVFAGQPDLAGNPLAARVPHFTPKAKRVIHLFMNGGPSHVDTFDPKSSLDKYGGMDLPGGAPQTERPTGTVYPSPFKFQKCGESGIEVSEIFPNVGRVIDEIAVIRSCHGDSFNHEPSLMLMNCGETRLVRPSVGSWVTYGLGTENQNLPAFVALCPDGYPIQESQNWQAGFLPGIFQGTYINTRETDPQKLLENIRNQRLSGKDQRRQLELVQKLNAMHRKGREDDPELEARIQSFELAYRMQIEATEAFDVSRESQSTLDMYGPGTQARQILTARRLAERGVRYLQVWHGAGQPWDSHDDIEIQHRQLAGQCDQAIGALLTDLKQRGLLDETLVIWGGEFGRTPTVELPKKGSNQGKVNGRDHNHYGFTMWMAGGGVRGGYVHGATDEFGFKAVENRVHVHDIHATILHLMGFDHTRLTYRHAGRDFRLTDVHGNVVHDLIA